MMDLMSAIKSHNSLNMWFLRSRDKSKNSLLPQCLKSPKLVAWQSRGEGLPTSKCQNYLSKWLCKVTWHKNIKSQLSKYLLPSNLSAWWLTVKAPIFKVKYPFNDEALQFWFSYIRLGGLEHTYVVTSFLFTL